MRFEGWDAILDTPRLRLALERGNLEVARTLALPPLSHRRQVWFYPAAVATYLDAVAALGDREAVEAVGGALLEQEDSVLQAFALRALGIVRGDRALLDQAAARFRTFGLEHQVATTLSAGGETP
jgi:hypothetical protein